MDIDDIRRGGRYDEAANATQSGVTMKPPLTVTEPWHRP